MSVYLLLASGLVFPSHPLTGDEPHYLLITQSLIEDGDIDVANNYMQQTYRSFYPGEMEVHAAASEKKPGRLFSRHLPGLPVLLLPIYFLGDQITGLSSEESYRPSQRRWFIFFVRLPMCVMAALLGWLFFHLAYDVLKSRKWAIIVWSSFVFTAPLLFFSHLVYPEIPVALITLWIYLHSVRRTRNTPIFALLMGAGLASLPWFGVKYLVVAIGMWAIAGIYLLKPQQKRLSRLALFLTPGLVSGGLFLLFLWSTYGSISPVSIYRGVIPDKFLGVSWYLDSTLLEFFSHGMGILVDQRVGIFAYAPLFLLCIPGFFLWARKQKQESYLLALLLILYWTLYAWIGAQEGYCPPGRHLLAIFWIAALFTAVAMGEASGRWPPRLIKAGLALNGLVVVLTISDPRLLYHHPARFTAFPQAQRSHLLSAMSNSLLDFRKLVPSFVDEQRIAWLFLIFLAVVIAIITAVFLIRKPDTHPKKRAWPMACQSGLILMLSMTVLAYVFFDIQLEEPFYFPQHGYTLYFQDSNNYGPELDGFWTKGGQKTGVLIETKTPLASLEVSVSSQAKGKTIVNVGGSRRVADRNNPAKLSASFNFLSPTGFPWKGRYLYSVTIYDPAVFVPVARDPRKPDNRRLGVFVRITAHVEPQSQKTMAPFEKIVSVEPQEYFHFGTAGASNNFKRWTRGLWGSSWENQREEGKTEFADSQIHSAAIQGKQAVFQTLLHDHVMKVSIFNAGMPQ